MIINKLIRDKMPEIFEAENVDFKIEKIDSDDKYLQALYNKVLEEVEEFKSEPSAEEMADIIEVLAALCNHLNISSESVDKISSEKYNQKGGFKKRIFLKELHVKV